MARTFFVAIVCLSSFSTKAQTELRPITPTESEIRTEYIRYFSHPIQLRSWEINDDTVDAWKRWELVENYSFGIDRGSTPMITDLQSLHPYFRDKVIALIRACRLRGIEIAVVETYRTHTKQNEYRSMGRKFTVSRGGYSNHQYGLAVDVVPVKNSVAQWHNIALWRRVGVIGERLGLRWGSRWRRPFDPGHFEWTGGLWPYHMAQGIFPVVPNAESYPCIAEDLKALRRHWRSWEIEQSAVARKDPGRATNPMVKQATQGGD